jgi:DNA mismatch endonuclease (patch repair protein)
MAQIKGKDTKPEKLVRSLLHRMGYRFRLHDASLPGKPDIVLARHRKVIFVNGCFWHEHKKCRKGSIPTTNTEFWLKKISSTIKHDRSVRIKLKKEGWKILTIWECELRDIDRTMSKLDTFMNS